MSNNDRGAYTPPTEESLPFDARRARSSAPAPLTLIISGVVFLVLLVALVLMYQSGTRSKGEVPSVGTATGVQKVAPGADQAKPLTDSDITPVYGQNPAPSNPAFRKGPETPQPLTPETGPVTAGTQGGSATTGAATSAPATAPATSAPTNGTLAHPSAPVTTQPLTTPSQPAPVKPALKVETVPAPVAKPVAKPEVKAEAKPEPKPSATTASGATASSAGAVVQIGAYTSREIADREFAAAASSMGPLAAKAKKHVEPVEVDGKTRYRTQFTGFASKDQAKQLCDALKASGHTCIVK